MNERTRIENPTCDTCRWLVNGYCYLNPPRALMQSNSVRPLVRPDDFCSWHTSAFEQEQVGWTESTLEDIGGIDLPRHPRLPDDHGSSHLNDTTFICEHETCGQRHNGVPDNWVGSLDGRYQRFVCPDHLEFLGQHRIVTKQ